MLFGVPQNVIIKARKLDGSGFVELLTVHDATSAETVEETVASVCVDFIVMHRTAIVAVDVLVLDAGQDAGGQS